MQAILKVFRGEATLASAPEQVFATTTTTATTATPETAPTSTPMPTTEASSSAEATPGTTLPVVSAEENNVGVAPDRSVTCD